MARRYFIFIDATEESHAPFFKQTPIFQTWLRSFDNVPEALEFIREITLPRSIQIYIARDNILDDGLPSETNGQIRTLLDTFCDLRTVHHITIFCPNINTDDLEQQIHTIMSDPRALKQVVSAIDLHAYMCKQGEEYFTEEINYCIHTKQIHLISNLRQDLDKLMEYYRKIIDDRNTFLDTLEENHSNKPGQEPS